MSISTSKRLRVLIVGGYGIFGGRLVDLLCDDAAFDLVIAGRSEAKARAFCNARANTAAARLTTARFDRDGDLGAQLAVLAPDIVADASGPWQAYGDKPYALIEACLAQRCSYLDLADGAEFVDGVVRFDESARGAGIFILSGVSSFPVLTAAVVRALSSDMTRVTHIIAGIAPSPFAVVGPNVIRAIASYGGKRIALRRGGRDTAGYGLAETRRFTPAPPGVVPLRSTLFSLVEVPDLLVLRRLWPSLDTIWIGAGPRPEILHRLLIGFAWLVRLRLLPSLTFTAPLMHWATRHLRWGDHRGGMIVVVAGITADDRPLSRSWHMVAEGNDGPYIPSMAIAGLLKKQIAGATPSPGARAATHELELGDYDHLFAGRAIYTGIRDTPRPGMRLYPRILAGAYAMLPSAIRAMHDTATAAAGRATITRGRSPLSRLVSWLVGFPTAGHDVPLTVSFDVTNDSERWTRTFGEKSFSSVQTEGAGRSAYLLRERFGPLSFDMTVTARPDRLRLQIRHWRAFGLAMPEWLAPRVEAFETETPDGLFAFHVEIGHPSAGLIVRYQGVLTPT